MKGSMDIVGLGVAWDRLIAIADEMTMALVRTAFSSVVRESYDLSCVLFDAQAQPMAQGTFSMPTFTGTAPLTLQHLLKIFPPETLKPGDVIATNDPWMGTGHVYDICVACPVFRGGRIIAYTMTITHLPDIGGRGMTADAREMYEEGMRLRGVRLLKEGRPNEFLFDLIRTNVRVPEQVLGDINANIGANLLGARLVQELLDELGLDDVARIASGLMDQTERVVRAGISRIPSGVYRNHVFSEAWDRPIRIACEVHVQNDHVTINFDGSDDPVPAAINVPFCYSRSLALYALKCLTAPDLPNNAGAIRPVDVIAPQGSILNPVPPAATAGRHVIGHLVPSLIYGALANVLPEAIPADPGMYDVVPFVGTHADGNPISTVFFASGGMGAMAGKDGDSTVPAPSNMVGISTEAWETLTSISVLRKTLIPDSGGPGEARGGLGQEIVMRNDTGNPLTVSCFASRTNFAPVGRRGGKDGALRQTLIDGSPVHPKGRYVLQAGQEVAFREAGGGGVGDPRKRSRALVEADIENGFVTIEAAEQLYSKA